MHSVRIHYKGQYPRFNLPQGGKFAPSPGRGLGRIRKLLTGIIRMLANLETRPVDR